MIAIVDSGVANLASVVAAFDRLGISCRVTAEPSVLAAAKRVILPGVGSAPAAMRELRRRGLDSVVRSLTCPVMGICLGLQLLFDSSQEGGSAESPTPCLGLIPAQVRKLETDGLPLPHMGWNAIRFDPASSPLFEGLESGCYMYFVHSFAAPLGSATLAQATYGAAFSALCGHRQFYGCQFHPERSGEAGARLLRNFAKGNL